MGDVLRKVKGGKFIGWYVRYKDSDGRRKARASHQPSKELARRYLVEIEARVARGHVGIAEPAPAAPTVAKLCERFLAEYTRPKIKDPAQYRANAGRALRRALPLVGGRPADKLSAQDAAKTRDALSAKYAPASVRLTLSFLAAAFSWGVKQGLFTHNPMIGVERPTPQPSIDYFARDEIEALLKAGAEQAAVGSVAAKRRYVAVQLALYTGLRKGELLGLRWIDLDLDGLRLTAARSFHSTPKSGKVRHLRLPKQCVPSLREWRSSCPKGREGLVFPDDEGNMHGVHDMLGLPELLQAAECRGPAHPWHCLRHSFASHFIMAGGNILTLQKILGHSDVKVTLVYAHLAPDFLGDEMDRLKF